MRNNKSIIAAALIAPALALGGGIAYASTTGGPATPTRPAVTSTVQPKSQHPTGQVSNYRCDDWRGHGNQHQATQHQTTQHQATQHRATQQRSHHNGYQGRSGYGPGGYGGNQGNWGSQGSGQHGHGSRWGNGDCGGGWR